MLSKRAIILGTGLGGLIEELEIQKTIAYEEIPHFPLSTVESHKGNLLLAKLGGVDCLVMQGRFHHYEGYSLKEVSFPVRVFKQLGVDTLFISNASGALNLDFEKGDLMLIDDHINFFPGNPLIGPNNDDEGPRFPDMSQPYDKNLIRILKEEAKKLDIALQEGVYLGVSGPTLETRAEYRMMRSFGADVVGMSTVPEVIIAQHVGIKVAAVSVVTDIGDPDNLKAVSLQEIIAVARDAEKRLIPLIKAFIKRV